MLRFLLGRLTQSALVLLLAVSVVFLLLRAAPGDPLSAGALDATTTAESRDALRQQFALDRSVAVQYTRFVGGAFRGDLGMSLSRGRPVTQVLREVLPNTLLLMGSALLLGIFGGVALGAWQGARPKSFPARLTHRVGLVLLGTPEYIVATAMITLFASSLHFFPVGGMVDLGLHDSLGLPGRIADVLRHLTLPALTLALVIATVVARYQRTEMRAVLQMPFIRTARAKGAPESRVLLRHALRNAMGPVITLCGLLLPSLVGGAVFVEAIFVWPGMGRLMVDAVNGRDYPLAIGAVLLSSALVALGGLLADVASAWADPRVRAAR